MNLIKLLGDLFVLALIALGVVASCSPAKAATPGYFIRCSEYSSATGHMLKMNSYIAYWDLSQIYPDEQTCDNAADKWVNTQYHGNVLADGSRALVQCWCQKVKA